MEQRGARQILQTLAQGRDPFTGAELPAKDQAAPDPGPGEHHQQVVEAAAGAEAVLGQGGHGHVVVDHRPLDPEGVGDQLPSGTGCPNPGRLAAPNSSPVSWSTRPGEPIPTPASLDTATLASLAAALTTAVISATTAAGPPLVGVLPLASPSRDPSSSTTTPWTLVPPRSIPTVCMPRMMPASSDRWSAGSAPWSTKLLAPVA